MYHSSEASSNHLYQVQHSYKQVPSGNLVIVAVQEVSSRRSCWAPLLQVALLCEPAALPAPVGQSSPHTVGRKVHDHQVQTGQLGFWWSAKLETLILKFGGSMHAWDTHPRVGVWEDCPSTFQHYSICFNIQGDLFLFKHNLLVWTHFGSTLTILGVSSLK